MAAKRKRPALVRARTDSDPEDIATPAQAPPPEVEEYRCKPCGCQYNTDV
jgi:hypothetical protein